ncbi:MAG: class I SAM-dependent methyltransferase [Turicibacter sp.]|nr:class I SAM-dependent methyltransferase [Turicibacter sp.]
MHYYTNNVDAASKEKVFEFPLRGFVMKFKTDIGVFSKNEVDFGSRVLIDSFSEPPIEGSFLDVGCGYGPIGLSLAKTYPDRNIEMIDVNERATGLSKKNAIINDVHNIDVYQSDIYNEVKNQFAAILSNPPIRAGKQVVHAILEGAKEKLLSGGELWIVIQKKQGAPSAEKKMVEVFGNCSIVEKKKGYFILKSKKD